MLAFIVAVALVLPFVGQSSLWKRAYPVLCFVCPIRLSQVLSASNFTRVVRGIESAQHDDMHFCFVRKFLRQIREGLPAQTTVLQ